MILVDGIAFQDPWHPGICRVWKSVFQEWIKSGFAGEIVILDRDASFPEMPGIKKVPFPRWQQRPRGNDALAIQKICDELQAGVFISTLYTAPTYTPSVSLVLDFIPERLGLLHRDASAEEKKLSLLHSSNFVCISESTKRDLLEFYPMLPPEAVSVAMLGVAPELTKTSQKAADDFVSRHKITRPFFLIVGERIGLQGEREPARGYKNAKLFFEAYQRWGKSAHYDVVVIGGATAFEEELRAAAPRANPIMVRATDRELAAAYSAAFCLVYPSKYEGFGLPVAEAMRCGCPVITSNSSSLPEVGGEAPIYIDPENVQSLLDAMHSVTLPGVREKMSRAGFVQAEKFLWKNMAVTLESAMRACAEKRVIQGELWNVFRKNQTLLEEETEKNAVLKHALKSMQESCSWKITAPLRGLDYCLLSRGR